MRALYFIAGLALMLLGIYFLGQNVIFTTHAYPWWRGIAADRKSTRLNSSHRCISYAVFCLKKKNKKK